MEDQEEYDEEDEHDENDSDNERSTYSRNIFTKVRTLQPPNEGSEDEEEQLKVNDFNEDHEEDDDEF